VTSIFDLSTPKPYGRVIGQRSNFVSCLVAKLDLLLSCGERDNVTKSRFSIQTGQQTVKRTYLRVFASENRTNQYFVAFFHSTVHSISLYRFYYFILRSISKIIDIWQILFTVSYGSNIVFLLEHHTAAHPRIAYFTIIRQQTTDYDGSVDVSQ